MGDELRHATTRFGDQLGALTAKQLGEVGLGPDQRRRRVRGGTLDRVGDRTFRSPLLPPTDLADLHSLVLDCGRNTFVSGPTAASLHGFDGFRLEPPFHVTIVRGRNVQRAHHVVHTTTELPLIDRTRCEGLPTMSGARTLIDLARFVGPKLLTIAVDSALRDGRTSEELLHRRIVELRSKGRYGIPKLIAVIDGAEASRGGHSWLERRFLELCACAGFPRPETQVVLARAKDAVVRVDCRFPGTAVVVELLGYRWHRTKDQLSRDAERLNALVMEGLRPLQFTYEHVTAESRWVIDQLGHALCVTGTGDIRHLR